MTYQLYDFQLSGNCYKVRLLLTQLGIPFELIPVNLRNQETKLPAFLQKNPNGKVPVLAIAPETWLTESGAILIYLAEGTPFWSDDRLEKTRILQWLFFEQYSLGPNLSRPRFFMSVIKQPEQAATLIPYWQTLGNQALAVMEEHLATCPFFVGNRYTIADIALYAYTHVAAEGGYDLTPFPAIRAWCDRVKSQPFYIPLMPD
jgi:glutathione S-transferase